ncbi:serine protease inhibitor 5 precursor [Danaus plexippus plexippus]|uniref:Serine protease inhibitor 5 n=1 Tax=Danaus plexippus plexippus TaxID=278856 RepID=A0A212FMS1_DANPL|nr:serine protease inhibitor 5 precursor [Danaus plexippus plexippus]
MIGSILLSILFVAASESLDYTATARNFSIELVYFTQTKTDHEVVLAPFGLWSLMGQVAFAANGPTRYELQRTLISNASNEDNYFNNLDKLMSRLKEPSDGVEMIIKNFLFRDQSLKVPLDFVTRVEQTKGNIWSLDFTDVTAPRLLNTIIKSNTKFPIPVFGPNDFNETDLIFSNVFSFKGLSEEPLYVETIEQRARIFVTEEGVDAYATIPANLEIATRTNPNYAQPFIFFIVHKSTVTILMGGIYGKS